MNLYTYVHNNPLTNVDPTGHWGQPNNDFKGDIVASEFSKQIGPAIVYILTEPWAPLSPGTFEAGVYQTGKGIWKGVKSLVKEFSKDSGKIAIKEETKLVEIFNPMNKGPLPDAVANTFRSGTYIKSVIQEETTMYRVYGGKAGELSSYWTTTKPQGPLQSTIDSALDQKWGNTATNVATIKVPKGTTIYQGTAASQGGLVGGGNQVYIEKVDYSWLVK